MNNRPWLQTTAITAASTIVASIATFFVARHIFKKPDVINNQLPIQNQNVESNINTIKSEINSIKDDIKTIKTTNTAQKKLKKITAKTTDDIQNNNSHKYSINTNDANIKKFNEKLFMAQQKHLNENHRKNAKAIINYIRNANTVESSSEVIRKTNDRPIQNILIDSYYETESNKVRTIYMPINDNDDIITFNTNLEQSLNEKIQPLKEINYECDIKKENAKHIKEAIETYCFKKKFKCILNKSSEHAKNKGKNIKGFFISEHKIFNNTNNYTITSIFSKHKNK